MSESTNQDICSVLDQFQRSSKKSTGNANLCIVIKSTSKRYTNAQKRQYQVLMWHTSLTKI